MTTPVPAPAVDTLIPAGSRLSVISPHLDDAVMGCGALIGAYTGSVVLTAFAGRPERYPPLTSWDARAGFQDGDDVVAARQAEDRAALATLAARPVWLPFPDPQYVDRPTRQALADALGRALDEAGNPIVVMALGLFHDDHILTGDAALDVRRARSGEVWIAYADAIYRAVPNLLTERLAALDEAGFELQPLAPLDSPDLASKRRALDCYASQLRALAVSWEGGYEDAFRPEQFWLVRVRPDEAAAPPAPRTDDDD